IGEFVHKNKQSNNGKYPVFNGGRQNTGYYDEYNNTANKVIISARGANAGFVNKVYTNFWAGNSCYSLSPIDSQKLNWEYLFYSLKNMETELLNNQQTGSIPALSKRQIEEFYIPLPPIEVQEEIVRILDNFTKCTAELQAELQAREEQYEYYRNKLLSFEGRTDVEYKKLGDNNVSVMQRGSSLTKKDATEGPYPVISGGKTPAFYCDKFNREGETITVAGSGAGAGYVQYWNEPIFVCDAFSVKGVNNNSTKYLYYCLTNLQDKIYATKKGSGVPHVHISSIDKFEIPLPPIEVQEEIVNILDKFETLVNDLSQGLPAEIEARQNQYEFYRNKLLSFKRLTT
ncbi:MAG: restriction endonuclease subunit S, partial [Bacteroidales bacterium]|nr:restriction endonuclease subunit S [Bacteroidales bacterium]